MSKTQRNILLIEDNIDDVELCHRALKVARNYSYEIYHVTTAKAGLDYLDEAVNTPHCVLLDYSLPDANGLTVLEAIRRSHTQLPVVILTGQGNEETAVRLLQTGAQDYIVKSAINEVTLLRVIEGAISHEKILRNSMGNESDTSVVLVVDDDPEDREFCVRTLMKFPHHQYVSLEANCTEEMFEQIASGKAIDCILLDYAMPGVDGLCLLRKLKSQYPLLPIIMMTGQGNESIAVSALKSGAQDYLVKSSLTPELLESSIRNILNKTRLERGIAKIAFELRTNIGLNDAILDNTTHMITASDGDGVVTQFNRAGERMLGYQASDVIGKHSPLLWHDMEAIGARAEELSLQLNQKVEPGLEVFSLIPRLYGHETREWDFIRKDGSRLLGKLTVTCIRNDKTIIGYLGVMEDITHEKRDKSMLAGLYNIASSVELTCSQKIDAMLASGCEYLGVSIGIFGYIEGDSYIVRNALPKDQIPTGHSFGLDKVYCGRVFGRPGVHYLRDTTCSEIFYQPDELEFLLKTYIGTTVHVDDRPYGVLSFCNPAVLDIVLTEKELSVVSLIAKWIGYELSIHHKMIAHKALINQLQSANEELEKFAYLASHDLKSPLRAIDNLSTWLHEDAQEKLDRISLARVAMIRQRVNRMEKFLDDLLEYCRVGSAPDDTKSCRFTDFIENIKDFLDVDENTKITTAAQLSDLVVDQHPLEQIFINLIANSIKHHDKSEKHIRIGYKNVCNYHEFSVIDDGPGVDERYREKIFDMFQTLRPRDEVEGSGVGLALIKKIITKHGGDISVASNEGRGCIFRFTWPM